MELKGVFSQDIISRNDTIDLKGIRNVKLQNQGTSVIKIGKYKELAGGETMSIGDNITLMNNTPITVIFSETGTKRLYIEYVKIQKP